MFTNFNELPDNARIWIYQSNRKLSEVETQFIAQQTEQFLTQWTAHGENLEAGFLIKYDRFLILGLNQNSVTASGCSIDASVHFIQSLEKKLNIDLLDKMNVTFYTGNFLTHKTLVEFKEMVKSKAISPETIVFNNLVNTKQELEENWEIPAKESWHSRFFKK